MSVSVVCGVIEPGPKTISKSLRILILLEVVGVGPRNIRKIPENSNSGLRKISEFMHFLCFPENEPIASSLLWDGCNWFTEYGR